MTTNQRRKRLLAGRLLPHKRRTKPVFSAGCTVSQGDLLDERFAAVAQQVMLEEDARWFQQARRMATVASMSVASGSHRLSS